MLDVMKASRTTLSIDNDVLVAAKQLAEHSGRSVGAELSDLARQALTHVSPQEAEYRNGILLLPRVPGGRPVTDEDVDRLREEHGI